MEKFDDNNEQRDLQIQKHTNTRRERENAATRGAQQQLKETTLNTGIVI